MTSLQSWLDRIFTIRSGPEIEMGLERIRPVFEALNVAPSCPVFLIAGTNGKGSVCAYLDAILRAAGYKTARYTSPHIHRFNERVCVNGVDASDVDLVAAFEAVEAARAAAGDLALTFFEYTTLAAFHVFSNAKLDAWIIEVGLGGRLDATNILDPDCSVIVSIGLDHMEFLGPTREHIAREKAGILRANMPAIIAEPDPPQSLRDAVNEKQANAFFVGRDYGWRRDEATPSQWSFWIENPPPGGEGRERVSSKARALAEQSSASLQKPSPPPSPPGGGSFTHRHSLPVPALRGGYQLGNAAASLAALHALRDKLPVSQGAIKQALLEVEWPGRFQVLPGRPTIVLDVAHNEHAAKALDRALSDMAYFPETHAVFAMLKDKDITAVVSTLKGRIDHWHIAPLPGARGVSADALGQALAAADVKNRAIRPYTSVAEAFSGAKSMADEADRILVFGSFLTVAACSA